MAYTITYDSGALHRRPGVGEGKWLWLGGLALVGVGALWLCWPQGMDRLRQVLMPWDRETVAAFSRLMAAVGAGEPFVQAVAQFCRQVIGNGLAV